MACGAGYRIFGTTADLGVAAWAPSLAEACAQTARGMFAVLVDLRTVRPRQPFHVAAEGADAAGMLVAFLNELLYLHVTQVAVVRRFDITLAPPHRLRALAWGEAIDPRRHRIETEIKAATYHRLSLTSQRGKWRARVILDV